MDNRLTWFLGRLDQQYGQDARYVWLSRDLEQVAASCARTFPQGMMAQWVRGVTLGAPTHPEAVLQGARDMVASISANIRLFSLVTT